MSLAVAYGELQPGVIEPKHFSSQSGESMWLQEHLHAVASNKNQRYWNPQQQKFAQRMAEYASASGFVMLEKPLENSKKERIAVVATDRSHDYEIRRVVPPLLGVGIMFDRAIHRKVNQLTDGDLLLWARTFDQVLPPFARDYLLAYIPQERFDRIFSTCTFHASRPMNIAAVHDFRNMISEWKTPMAQDKVHNRNHESWSYWQRGAQEIVSRYYGSVAVCDPRGLCSELKLFVEYCQYQVYLHRKPTSGVKPMSGYEVVDVQRHESFNGRSNLFIPVVDHLTQDDRRNSLLQGVLRMIEMSGCERAIKGTLEEQYTIVGSVA